MNSVTGLALLVTSLSTLITAVGGLIVSVRNSRKIVRVQEATNGKMEAFIQEVREASFAKGVKSEHDKETKT